MKRAALLKEGLTDAQITVDKDRIVENENGFISWKLEHCYPYITHALVYPEKRNGWNWLRLFIKFKKEMKRNGYNAFIAEVIGSKEYFDRMLKFLGGNEPYAINENGKYYLVRFKE